MGTPIGGGRVVMEVICWPGCQGIHVEWNKESGSKAHWKCLACPCTLTDNADIGRGEQQFTRAKLVQRWVQPSSPSPRCRQRVPRRGDHG